MEPPPTLPPQRPPPSPPPSPLAPAVEEGRQLDIEVLYVLFGIVMVLCGFFMYLQVVKRRRRKLIKAVEARDRERTEKRAMELQAQKSRVSVAVQSREERMSSESQRRRRWLLPIPLEREAQNVAGALLLAVLRDDDNTTSGLGRQAERKVVPHNDELRFGCEQRFEVHIDGAVLGDAFLRDLEGARKILAIRRDNRGIGWLSHRYVIHAQRHDAVRADTRRVQRVGEADGEERDSHGGAQEFA